MRFRDLAIRNTVSPHGLAMLSYAFFLFACSIPPSIYSSYMHEPDLMFLDPAAILFYTLCVAAFVAGVGLVGWLYPASPLVERKLVTKISPVLFLLAPLVAGIVLTALSARRMVADNPEIVWLLLTQQGDNLKSVDALIVDPSFLLAPILLTGSIWFVFWRAADLKLGGWRKWIVNTALCIAVLAVTGAAMLTLSRNLLMVVFSGLAILYFVRRTASRQLSTASVIASAAAIGAGILLLFAGFSFLRGSDRVDLQIDTLFEYSVPSYNRLAAIVHGELRYPFAGRGVYLSPFVSFSHLFNRVIPMSQIMNWPSFGDVWSSEFGAVRNAGLNDSLIWSGAFGYIFSDLGWFSPPLLLFYGVLYGLAWNSVRRGRIIGILIYPYMGFCVLFWIGTNYLFDLSFFVLLAVAALLAAYDRVFAVACP